MFSMVQRMILWDLIKVFAVTLVSLTGLFLLGGLVAEASQRGLAPAQVLTIIPLMVPSMLPYTIPAATLFAACNVYGRLAKDNEITALRAAGVNLRVILIPSLLMGLASTVATAALYYHTIPRSYQLVREHLLSDTNELLYTLLKRNGCIKHKDLPYVLFVREVRGGRLIDVVFKRLASKSTAYDTVARAREATMSVERVIDSRSGKEAHEIVVSMSNCVLCREPQKDGAATLLVRKQEFRERLPSGLFGDKDAPRSCDLPWPALTQRTEELRERERQRDADIAADEARLAQMTPHEREVLSFKKDVRRYALREFRSYEAEVQLRPALALGCLCFALLGGPIGIWANRADFLSTFVIGFLPAVSIYYPLVMCGVNLAKDSKVHAVPAVWTGDLLFLLVALFLCYRVVRR